MELDKPLNGKKIIVTRGESQANEFSEKIEEVGGIPIKVPLLSFQYPQNITSIKEEIENISTYDWLVFTSKNGVEYFFDLLKKNSPFKRDLPKIAVVGPKTEEVLNEYGFKADVVPVDYVAEGLLEALLPQIQQNDRILLARGNLSREHLVMELEKTAAYVKDLIIYENVENTEIQEELLTILRNENVDVITFTSSSTVRNFIRMVEGSNWTEYNQKCAVACIGPITKKSAVAAGLRVDICPNNYTLDDLLEEIISFYKNR